LKKLHEMSHTNYGYTIYIAISRNWRIVCEMLVHLMLESLRCQVYKIQDVYKYLCVFDFANTLNIGLIYVKNPQKGLPNGVTLQWVVLRHVHKNIRLGCKCPMMTKYTCLKPALLFVAVKFNFFNWWKKILTYHEIWLQLGEALRGPTASGSLLLEWRILSY
jgi:hypothetical protein